MGRMQAEPPPLRPPWALGEAAFLTTCTGCGDCVKACPADVLVAGDGGYPAFDPALGECLFCEACADACEPRALDKAESPAPWPYRAVIGDACLARRGVVCLSCRDACGEMAIRFPPARGVSLPELDADRCTGCGACVGTCPVSAIAISSPVPAPTMPGATLG
ncbi:ferredoxin-type protein NapF [Sphingomonas laterariae]|uniref:Ferredoxin-type protein NapF n=2 Tax=Edaphosphingomonas laterariae TaxID=861865 RepID=A0A239BU04_9SPHN|nr:ferredoxin-type protein NapF [Sphingomonas laterariae]